MLKNLLGFLFGSDDEAWHANIKRTYDSYQEADKNRMETIHNLNLQLLQNGVTAANFAKLQALRHMGVEADRLWNVDEVAQLVAKTPAALDAIAAAVVDRVVTGITGEDPNKIK